MNTKIKKIDAIIIVIMIAIAGFVVFKVGILPKGPENKIPEIEFIKDDEKNTLTVKSVSDEVLWSDIGIDGICDKSALGRYVKEGDQIKDCVGTIVIKHKPTNTVLYTYKFEEIPIPPESIILGNMRDVSPEDEGVHFNTIANMREWWFFTVVFDKDSNLSGWTATIGFMHMAWGDLKLTFKPDVLVVILHSPDGKEYGGMINKQRGKILGIFGDKTLEAKTPGVDLKYEDSWAEGMAPKWHVHADDKDIDEDDEIIMDLDYFAPSSPLWIHSSRPIDLGEGNIADYIFTGCKVSGEIKLNGLKYGVTGIGHHEHSWSLGVVKLLVKGWDWCHMTLDNGWNIYYNKYYITRQILDTQTTKINPYATIIITTDNGKTITQLDDIDITIEDSDKLFLLLKMPTQISISAKPSISQIFLKSYKIRLNIEITAKKTYDQTWKFPTFVGMKIGLDTVSGTIKWSDDQGDHDIKLNGTGTIWNMRRL